MRRIPGRPELPCHSCVPHHNGPLGEPDNQGLRWPRYGWRIGYGWHSAFYNVGTGEWRAMCHEDHIVRGRVEPRKAGSTS